MVRRIYSNAIYLRKKQNERKVYQRKNNVLPTDVPGAEEENPIVSEVPPVVEETQNDESESDETLDNEESDETEDEE